MDEKGTGVKGSEIAGFAGSGTGCSSTSNRSPVRLVDAKGNPVLWSVNPVLCPTMYELNKRRVELAAAEEAARREGVIRDPHADWKNRVLAKGTHQSDRRLLLSLHERCEFLMLSIEYAAMAPEPMADRSLGKWLCLETCLRRVASAIDKIGRRVCQLGTSALDSAGSGHYSCEAPGVLISEGATPDGNYQRTYSRRVPTFDEWSAQYETRRAGLPTRSSADEEGASPDDWAGNEAYDYDRMGAQEWGEATPEYRAAIERRFAGWEARVLGNGDREWRRRR